MIRHWFASGLVTGAFLATTTFAQVYYNGPAEPEQRVSQLRPGWSPNGIDPAMARSRYVVSPAPVHLAQVSESSGHSFLPSWFSWGYNKPERREMSNSNPTQRRNFVGQPEIRGSVKPGNAADAMPPDPATIQDGELPGLGGTRMPRNNGQASNGEYSQTGSPRTASREPLTEPSDNSPASSAGSVTRNSPARHTAPHISPEELRRELTGTFPMSSTKSSSSATTGTARTNGHTESGDDEAMISDVPGALPATTAKDNLTAPKGNPATSQHESVSPPVETSHKAESAFGVSKHSKSAYSTSSSVHIPFSSVAPIESRAARERSVKRWGPLAAQTQIYSRPIKRRFSPPIFAAQNGFSWAAKLSTVSVCKMKAMFQPKASSRWYASPAAPKL